jgi:Zn-finger nucleic acid-binding protein
MSITQQNNNNSTSSEVGIDNNTEIFEAIVQEAGEDTIVQKKPPQTSKFADYIYDQIFKEHYECKHETKGKLDMLKKMRRKQ